MINWLISQLGYLRCLKTLRLLLLQSRREENLRKFYRMTKRKRKRKRSQNLSKLSQMIRAAPTHHSLIPAHPPSPLPLETMTQTCWLGRQLWSMRRNIFKLPKLAKKEILVRVAKRESSRQLICYQKSFD